MKKLHTLIVAATLAACLFTACRNDAFTWEDYAYARVVGPENWTLGTDSLHFNFSVQPSAMIEFVVEAEIIIMGEVADRDRVVHLAVNPTQTTAMKETHYTILESVTIPAGEASAPCHITIRRTPELQSANVRLRVEIAPGGDLGPGVNEWNTLTIQWNDMISRPINWDDLTEFFGEYSDVKFRFIISTLGVSLFTYGDPDGMSWGMMNNYRLILADALARYNAEHPGNPLADENNQFITF
ncbi:MAG: DUF4843 domain-containing protein [Odoribacteraceae bacterium]|jgi:hypothetical protein|nr:DUF4843 domain-containing protein [Odoribacteraceae bacterium]